MEKKRLLKDLPITRLTAGVVVTKTNGGFLVDYGDTIYSSGGSSSNGQWVFDKPERDLMNLIWENGEWMEPAELKSITIKAETDKVVISFKPLDLAQAQTFAKGLQHTLSNHFGVIGSYTWNEFKGFEINLK